MRIARSKTARFLCATATALVGSLVAVAAWGSDGTGATKEAATKATATVAISGRVYRDLNDNGVMDPGEPGVGGLRVRDKGGDQSRITSSTGAYAFRAAPSAGYLQVETGWFRSQCPPVATPAANSCPAGPGANNAYLVNNQFIRYKLTRRPSSAANVGLVPDWPSRSMTIPAPVDGTIPANKVDVAARLSWTSDSCVGGGFEICTTASVFTLDGQVLNQGTTALTGVRARVYVPPGDCATGASIVGSTVPLGLSALSVSPVRPTCATRYLDLSFAGTLAPAAAVRVLIHGTTAAGPGTPGCDPKKIDKKLCPEDEPQGRGWLFGVSHIDQSGDPDSTFCAAGDMTSCPTGLHDKRRAPDDLDPAGHNVASTLGGASGYDLSAHAQMVDPTTVRAWVSNQATNVSPEKVRVKIWLPYGASVLAVPAKHNLITCDSGKYASFDLLDSALVVTCTFGGSVAPTISSPAIDITLAKAPSRLVVCVAPPSGAPPESVPASAGCDLSTNPTASSTNNDASATPAP